MKPATQQFDSAASAVRCAAASYGRMKSDRNSMAHGADRAQREGSELQRDGEEGWQHNDEHR